MDTRGIPVKDDYKPTEVEQRTAALLLLSGGMTVREASEVLGVDPIQIQRWMEPRDGKR